MKCCRRCRAEGYPLCDYCEDTIQRAAEYAEITLDEYMDLHYPETRTEILLEGEVLAAYPLQRCPT